MLTYYSKELCIITIFTVKPNSEKMIGNRSDFVGGQLYFPKRGRGRPRLYPVAGHLGHNVSCIAVGGHVLFCHQQ